MGRASNSRDVIELLTPTGRVEEHVLSDGATHYWFRWPDTGMACYLGKKDEPNNEAMIVNLRERTGSRSRNLEILLVIAKIQGLL